MKYHLHIYGCQMNVADAARVRAALYAAGHEEADENRASLHVFVSCSVRERVETRIITKLKKLKKVPGNKIILTGCMALVPKRRRELAPYVDSFTDIKDFITGPPRHHTYPIAYVPIMTGCNNYCSYCIVPYVRGRETSRPANEIIAEIKELVKKGYKEIWLVGQNVNSYAEPSAPLARGTSLIREDALRVSPDKAYSSAEAATRRRGKSRLGGKGFVMLLRQINSLPGEFWIKFISSHPKDFTQDLVKTIKQCEKVCHFLNLPAQHGSKAVLARMNRKYTPDEYLKKVVVARKIIPDIAISSDFIVGYPGETAKEFRELEAFFKKLQPAMAYINRYSPRPQTAAGKLKNDVPESVKIKRFHTLNNLLKKSALDFNQKFVGKTVKVLITAYSEKKRALIGKTAEERDILLSDMTDKKLIGEFVKVKIKRAKTWGLES